MFCLGFFLFSVPVSVCSSSLAMPSFSRVGLCTLRVCPRMRVATYVESMRIGAGDSPKSRANNNKAYPDYKYGALGLVYYSDCSAQLASRGSKMWRHLVILLLAVWTRLGSGKRAPPCTLAARLQCVVLIHDPVCLPGLVLDSYAAHKPCSVFVRIRLPCMCWPTCSNIFYTRNKYTCMCVATLYMCNVCMCNLLRTVHQFPNFISPLQPRLKTMSLCVWSTRTQQGLGVSTRGVLRSSTMGSGAQCVLWAGTGKMPTSCV